MVISPHAVVGALSAGVLVSNPLLALIVGIISHYLLDSIPHGEYHMSLFAGGKVTAKDLTQDALKVVIDLTLACLLLILIWSTGYFSLLVILAGAFGGLLPDGIQILGKILPNPILTKLNAMHGFFHCASFDSCDDIETSTVRSLSKQVLFVALVFVLTAGMVGLF